jgi:hypothetical protein
MRNIEQKFFHHSRFTGSTSPRKAARNYKPGGTGMLIVGDTTSPIKRMTRDRMGRWVAAHLSGGNGATITIITCYQVCQSNITGNNTAANQQISQLIEEKRATDPRKAFIHDLTTAIQSYQSSGDQIILVGDFNEPNQNESGMDTLAVECDLADLFGIRLGTITEPSTYQRSSNRLDYALISPGLLHAVKSAGYDPFGYRIPSDHRGFHIDFDSEMLLSYKPSPLAPIQQRDFNSKQPGIIPRYIKAATKALEPHDTKRRLLQMKALTHPNHQLAEALYDNLFQASQHAAKKCRHKYTTPWNPDFSKAWSLLQFYKLCKSCLTNPSIKYRQTIEKWQKQYPHVPQSLPTLDEIRAGLRHARLYLKTAKQHAAQLREQYLDERVQLYHHLDETGKAKAVERLKLAEATSRTYKKLQRLRNPTGHAGLSELKVPMDTTIDPKLCPNQDTHWRTERVPEEIERLLLERNRKHFGQAEGTPLTTPEITAQLSYDGSGPMAELILDGDYTSETIDEATRLFLKHLRRKTDRLLRGRITTSEFVGKLKSWNEKTSTSPSGIHLGHYHVLWRKHGLPDNHADEDLITNGQIYLLDFHVALMNYALKFGYSFSRWQNVVNVMILKEAGNPKIHRIRVLHLWEANYNGLLAIKWRKAMQHAENSHLLNDGLYGSRAGRSAHDPVFLEVLQNEIYQCSMKPGINFDLDATSCYDRILARLATVASRRFGMLKEVAMVCATTLEQAKYRLKTQLKITEASYQHCDIHPIHGTGQGSGNSPHIWAFVSSALFDAFQDRTPGAEFVSFDGRESIKIHMIGFVDDCTQRVNDFRADPQPHSTELTNRMTNEAQLWNDLLWSSGGALEIPKCSFHLIESDWRPNGTPFLKGGTAAPNLFLSNGLVPSQVQQKSNYESHKTLGCYVNPANSMKSQVKQLRLKSDKMAAMVSSNAFTQTEAKTLYRMIYLPSITYPLSVTCISAKDCCRIQSKMMTAIVPRCGYNRNMSLAIRNCPEKWGGAGFTTVEAEQGVHTTMTALKHLRSPESQPGQILRIALSWAQAYAGTSTFLWEDPTAITPDYPAPFIQSIRTFLSSIGAKIILSDHNSIVPIKLRENDEFIMEAALQLQGSKQTKAKNLAQINSCRRYLQIVTTADISNTKGNQLLPGVADGTFNTSTSRVAGMKFNQPKPPPQAWTTWKKFLLRKFTDAESRLRHPLRSYTTDHSHCRIKPPHIYNPTTQQLYQLAPDTGHYYDMRNDAILGYFHHSIIPISPEGYPVHVFDFGNRVRPMRNFKPPPTPNNTRLQGFESFLTTLEPWEHDLLAHSTLHDTPINIMDKLNLGDFTVSSDGSVIGDSASFGYVVSSNVKQRLIVGRGPAPGARPQSFRAEAYGALAVRRMLIRLSDFSDQPLQSEFEHFIDNQSVISRTAKAERYKYHTPNSTLSPDWDVITMVAAANSELPPNITTWVEGHQDSNGSRANLSHPALMNCEADDEATIFQDLHRTARPSVPMFPTTHAQLIIQGDTINSYYKTRIREAVFLPPYFQYLEKKFDWTTDIRQEVDWSIYKQIIRKYRTQQNTLVKHLHEIAPTGDIAHRNNHHHPHSCPACDSDYETNDHVLRCPARSRSTWRTKVLAQFTPTTTTSSHDPILLDILRDGTTRWLQQLPTIDPTDYPASYHALIRSQSSIGWSHLFRGRWSILWRRHHTEYVTRQAVTGKATDSSHWLRILGIKLLQAWFDLWKIRNTERHGKDEQEQKEIRRRFLVSQLTELYALRIHVLPAHRHLFMTDVTTHLSQRPNQDGLENWIHTFGAAIRSSVQQANARDAVDFHDIQLPNPFDGL